MNFANEEHAPNFTVNYQVDFASLICKVIPKILLEAICISN